MIGDEQSQPPVGLFLWFFWSPGRSCPGSGWHRVRRLAQICCATGADESLPDTKRHDAEFHRNSFRTRERGLRSDPDVRRDSGRGGSPSGFERGARKETRRHQHGNYNFCEKVHDPPAQIKRYIGKREALLAQKKIGACARSAENRLRKSHLDSGSPDSRTLPERNRQRHLEPGE